jgi:sortase A
MRDAHDANAARRPSRFDRPPEPRDWRWFIGGLGRTMISVGLLMFGFVAYQLWGTGIATAQAQNRLEREFDELFTAPSTTVAATSTTLTSTSTTSPTTDVPAPTSTQPAPPTTAIAPDAPGPPQNFEIGSPVARLRIERMDLDVIVVEGARTGDLENGPGHFPESSMPGRFGNAVIAGHRTTHGAHFGRVDELQIGDRMFVDVPGYGTYSYAVTGSEIVEAGDYARVVPTQDPSRATLTLVSCHPKWTARQRIIITGELVANESPQPLPPPADLPEPQTGSELPGEDIPVTSPTVDSVPTPTSPAGQDAGDSLRADAVATDAFSSGWFSDDRAWPHVAAWGAVLAAIGYAAFRLSARVRRNWVGALAGVVPFVLALYFFYENVIRLLPSAL